MGRAHGDGSIQVGKKDAVNDTSLRVIRLMVIGDSAEASAAVRRVSISLSKQEAFAEEATEFLRVTSRSSTDQFKSTPKQFDGRSSCCHRRPPSAVGDRYISQRRRRRRRKRRRRERRRRRRRRRSLSLATFQRRSNQRRGRRRRRAQTELIDRRRPFCSPFPVRIFLFSSSFFPVSSTKRKEYRPLISSWIFHSQNLQQKATTNRHREKNYISFFFFFFCFFNFEIFLLFSFSPRRSDEEKVDENDI